VFQQVVTHEADIGVASFEQATGVGTMNTGWHTRRSLAVMIMSDNSDQPISAGTLRQHGSYRTPHVRLRSGDACTLVAHLRCRSHILGEHNRFRAGWRARRRGRRHPLKRR